MTGFDVQPLGFPATQTTKHNYKIYPKEVKHPSGSAVNGKLSYLLIFVLFSASGLLSVGKGYIKEGDSGECLWKYRNHKRKGEPANTRRHVSDVTVIQQLTQRELEQSRQTVLFHVFPPVAGN